MRVRLGRTCLRKTQENACIILASTTAPLVNNSATSSEVIVIPSILSGRCTRTLEVAFVFALYCVFLVVGVLVNSGSYLH